MLFVVLIILALLLRAIVAPLVLIGTVVLSFTTALGLSALAFRSLFSFAGAGRLARPSGQVTGAPSTPVTTGHP